MFLDMTDEQRALRDELRDYFSRLISAEDEVTMRTERHGAAYRGVVKQLGDDDRLGVGWPAEYGGKGFGEFEQQLFTNEAGRGDASVPRRTESA